MNGGTALHFIIKKLKICLQEQQQTVKMSALDAYFAETRERLAIMLTERVAGSVPTEVRDVTEAKSCF